MPIYSFSLLIGVGAALGMGWVAWQATENDRVWYVNACLWGLFGALVGGRAVYVAVNWGYYHQHLLAALEVYQGGLSWPGALAGGFSLVTFYARHARRSVGETLSALFPLLTSLILMGCLAGWMDGYAYGPELGRGWGLLAVDELGRQAVRLPAQLICGFIAALWFVAFDPKGTRFPHPAVAGWLSLLGVIVILSGFTFLRTDPGITLHGLRLDTWAALSFGIVSLVGALASWRFK